MTFDKSVTYTDLHSKEDQDTTIHRPVTLSELDRNRRKHSRKTKQQLLYTHQMMSILDLEVDR